MLIYFQDFRTPKPAVFCSLSAKLGNTKVDEKALSSDDDGTGNGKGYTGHGFQSQPIVLTSSFKCRIKFYFLPSVYHQEI